MSNTIEIKVPDIGDFENVEIIDVLVSEGDHVEEESGLITLETDKAAMDVPAPQGGTIRSLKVKAGDKVSEGDVIALLEPAGDDGDRNSNSVANAAGAQKSEREAAGNGEENGQPRSDDGDAQPAKPDSGGQRREVKVPDIGDFTDVEIIDVLVAEGDTVEAEQGLITLETDKAAMDVPAPEAGRVVALKVKAGEKVSEGDLIAVLETAGGEPAGADSPAEPERASAAEKPQSRSRTEDQAKPEAGTAATPSDAERIARAPTPRSDASLPPIDEENFRKAHASPSVRKFARELGVDLPRVEGSGRKGRITHEDVKAFVKQVMQSGGTGGGLPAVPRVDFAKFGEIETRPLPRIKKISGPRLHASWVNVPHVTQHDEADITDMEVLRKALKSDAEAKGVKLTPLAFIVKACIQALREYPDFNTSLDGDQLVYKKYHHIGFAADTPQGLMVPVIRDADRMDIFEIAGALGDLSARAREGKLKAAEMQGGTFSISSLGGIGGTAFTPIVNAPEVAILGVSRARMTPVWDGEEFQPRLMLPLSLSYDHRVIDGAAAARFTTFLGDTLAKVRNLVL